MTRARTLWFPLLCLALSAAAFAADAPAPPAAVPAAPTAPAATAGELPPAPAERDLRIQGIDVDDSVPMTLQQCLLATLLNNYDVQIKRVDPLVARMDVYQSKAVFDPLLTVEGSQTNKKTPSADQLQIGLGVPGIQPFRQDTSTLKTTLAKRFITGGTLSFEYGFSGEWQPDYPFTNLNPSYNTNATFTLSHPLLRNAGIFTNEASILIALSAERASADNTDTQVISGAFDTCKAYWELVRSREDYRASLASLKRATDFRNLVRERIAAGTLAAKEIYDAEAQVASEGDAVEGARTAVLNNQESLKRVMNFADRSPLSSAPLLPVDAPRYTADVYDLSKLEAQALKLRPDLKAAREDKTQASIRRRYFRNQKLPDLTVELQHGWLGLGGDVSESMDTLGRGNFTQNRAALSLEYPIGNRQARAQYEQASLVQRQAALGIQNVQQQIILDVRVAYHNVLRFGYRVESSRAIQTARQQALDAMIDRFNAGKATSFDVVQSLERLALADKDLLNALTDYRIALAGLHRSVGDILAFQNIHVQGAAATITGPPPTAGE